MKNFCRKLLKNGMKVAFPLQETGEYEMKSLRKFCYIQEENTIEFCFKNAVFVEPTVDNKVSLLYNNLKSFVRLLLRCHGKDYLLELWLSGRKLHNHTVFLSGRNCRFTLIFPNLDFKLKISVFFYVIYVIIYVNFCCWERFACLPIPYPPPPWKKLFPPTGRKYS